ncbi:replication initiator protein A [Pseudomonas putida]|uniref:replication initiator protein A n=1 Tax=Pseudomonas putida TaxID=303 RepID=UPI00370C0E0C
MMHFSSKPESGEMRRESDFSHSTDTIPSSENALTKRIEKLSQLAKQKRPNGARPIQGDEQPDGRLRQSAEADDSSAPKQLSRLISVTEEDVPIDSFDPALDCNRARDSQTVMDVAAFRLSKTQKRIGEIHRYQLSDGYVEVSAAAHGMATVWDYDIVLMMVSHLTEAMNRYRKGKGEKPGEWFRANLSDILKFTRRGDGSRQAVEVEAALDRLLTTTLKIIREKGRNRRTEAEGLIAKYRVVSRTDTDKINSVEIKAPEWLYNEVINLKVPLVLAVHPDYFLIKSGIARFIYRQARRAAGKKTWTSSFQLLYERSGSLGTKRKFFQNLRCIVRSDNLPEYTLTEEEGKSGPLLVMRYRHYLPSSPARKGA